MPLALKIQSLNHWTTTGLATKSSLTLGIPWTVAHQSMRFPRQNTGVGCHFLLMLPSFLAQGISLSQRLAASPTLKADSLLLSHQGIPGAIREVPYLFII